MKNKTTKLALLAALSYSILTTDLSAGATFEYPTLNLAGTFKAIELVDQPGHTNRLGRVGAWLGRHKQDGTSVDTAGLAAYANAIPNVILASVRGDGTKVASIVADLKASLTPADKAFATAEINKAMGLTTNTTLDATLETWKTAIADSTKSATSLDILATLGLFPKMSNAVSYWNDLVSANGGVATNLQAAINSIPTLLLYMLSGNSDAARILVQSQTNLTEAEVALLKIVGGYVLTGTPNGGGKLLDEIKDAQVKALATSFVTKLMEAIENPVKDDEKGDEDAPKAPDFPNLPTPSEAKAKLITQAVKAKFTAAGADLTDDEIGAFVDQFTPTVVTTDTLRVRVLSDKQKAFLTVFADEEPGSMAALVFEYFQRKDAIASALSADDLANKAFVPAEVIEIIKTRPAIVSKIFNNGGFIDISKAAVSTAAIPVQMIAMVKTMTGEHANAILEELRAASGKGTAEISFDGALIDAIAAACKL